MKAITALMAFFKDSRRKLTVKEVKALSLEERQELGKLACKELSVKFIPTEASK